jgi:hypothetical protein
MHDVFIITISGFQQSLRRPTGLETLWKDLRRMSSERCVVTTPLPWDTDWSAIAEFVKRNAAPMREVVVNAYSWGAGWGFVNLAKRLGEVTRLEDGSTLGPINIDHAVLADPVYRSPWLPTWLPANPLSMTRLPHITVPRNVRGVSWFRQTQCRPCGHNLVAEDAKATAIEEPEVLRCRHEDMDDREEFRAEALCRAAAAAMRAAL